jgi:hypothetical protein
MLENDKIVLSSIAFKPNPNTMSTKVLLATLAGAVAAFLFGWIVFGVLLEDFYKSNTPVFEGLMKSPPNLIVIFLSNLVNAFLLAYIFNRWAGIRTAVEGAQAGFIIFAITSLAFDLMMYATMNMLTPLVMVVDVVGSGAFGAVTGAVVAVILGSRKNVVSA